MSQADDEDTRPWTENDLKEALRRINAGEINIKEAENYYGISPRTLHRQKAIESMRAQLNPEKNKKTKPGNSSTTKKDVTILRKPVEISCSSLSDVVSQLDTGTEEVKQLLNHECDLIYECKVCKNLFRSLVNFISHKRIYCCDMYSVLHTQNDENGDGSEINDPVKVEEKLKAKHNLKEFTTKPFRITCRKDLTTVLKRISAMSELVPVEPTLRIQSLENTSYAYQQSLVIDQASDEVLESHKLNESLKTVSATCEMEIEKETRSSSVKPLEKSAVMKPTSYVAEKRFRCPLCVSNFTIKKSVSRHIKSVHRKSDEQLARLKPRIQMHYVKKKKAPMENIKDQSPPASSSILLTASPAPPSSPPRVSTPPLSLSSSLPSPALLSTSQAPLKTLITLETSASPQTSAPTQTSQTHAPSVISTVSETSATTLQLERSPSSVINKSDQRTPDKGEWEKDCPCHRHFTNRNSYAAHMKVCRQKLALVHAAAKAPSVSKTSMSLLPIVSLTPINTTSTFVSAFENTDLSSLLSRTKKMTSHTSTQSKKVTLPPTATNSSSSKKIGIQVRMNYRKEGISQPNSINGTPTSYATPPSSIASAQSSADNSRQNSVIGEMQEEKNENIKIELLNGHNTRSSSKLSNLLRKLFHQQNVKEDDSSETEVKREDSNVTIVKKMENNDATIYCKDCKKTYPLNEYSGSCENGPRNFKCALRNCNFKSNNKNDLLPHLSAQHATLPENEWAEVDSIFIAETCERQEGEFDTALCCKLPTNKNKTEEKLKKETERSRKTNASSTLTSSTMMSASSKRKPNPNSGKQPQAKRKIASERSSASTSSNDEKNGKKAPEKFEHVTSKLISDKSDKSIRMENTADTSNSLVSVVTTKKLKNLKKENENKIHTIRTKKPVQTNSSTVMENGIVIISSSEEESEQPYLNIPKLNCDSKLVKKQNISFAESKVPSTLTKTNSLPSDWLQSTSMPGISKSTNIARQHLQTAMVSTTNISDVLSLDSDLDPATMSEETLKKSIMKIIFGTDVPNDEIEETIDTVREKSPASSSSSEGSKEKRYSFRAIKQTAGAVIKTATSVESKDDKISKVFVASRAKSPR